MVSQQWLDGRDVDFYGANLITKTSKVANVVGKGVRMCVGVIVGDVVADGGGECARYGWGALWGDGEDVTWHGCQRLKAKVEIEGAGRGEGGRRRRRRRQEALSNTQTSTSTLATRGMPSIGREMENKRKSECTDAAASAKNPSLAEEILLFDTLVACHHRSSHT